MDYLARIQVLLRIVCYIFRGSFNYANYLHFSEDLNCLQ